MDSAGGALLGKFHQITFEEFRGQEVNSGNLIGNAWRSRCDIKALCDRLLVKLTNVSCANVARSKHVNIAKSNMKSAVTAFRHGDKDRGLKV